MEHIDVIIRRILMSTYYTAVHTIFFLIFAPRYTKAGNTKPFSLNNPFADGQKNVRFRLFRRC